MTTEDTRREAVCSGCGISLQTENLDEPGFVPASALERENVICRRCFRIRNYGEFSRIVVPQEVYEQEVSAIASEPGLVFFVLDVFDLPGSMIPNLSTLIGRSRVVALVNKVDLLPKEVHGEALESWIRKELRAVDLNPALVLFVSGNSGRGVEEVISAMDREGQDKVYMVGMANVGKSTLLNHVVQRLAEHSPFTSSRVPGTTIGMVKTKVVLPSREEVLLADTPGLIHGNRVMDELCGDCLKVTVPQTAIRPRIYQLDSGQSIWLGGFARFDFLSGPHQPVVCYVSNDLVVHRTKLERADAIFADHADDILKVPCPECRTHFEARETYSLRSSRQKPLGNTVRDLEIPTTGCDIVLSGLGWISLQGSTIRGELHVPQHVKVTMRPRLIGQISRGFRS